MSCFKTLFFYPIHIQKKITLDKYVLKLLQMMPQMDLLSQV